MNAMRKILIAAAAASAVVALAACDTGNTPTTTSDGKQTVGVTGEKSKFTKGQQEAIDSAEQYLATAPFSKAGLIRQLSSKAGDGFPKKDATFAVNHIKVDWKEQAVKKAQSYLAFTHFSRSGMIAQLKYDKFTDAEAKYGTDKAFDSAE